MYPEQKPYKQAYLKVSELHSICYATYGNPAGVPVVVLHGGPGAGCSDTMSRFFDCRRYHVIMFDQRGCGKSNPFLSFEQNSPQHSVQDIETLRVHLGIERWVVFGGSWGSTLALLYGQTHPERVLSFILRGIFLGREQDYQHLLYGMGKVFPESYEPFLEYIPQSERDDLLSAYYQRLMDPRPEIHLPAAKCAMTYFTSCACHLPNAQHVQSVTENEPLSLCIARHFFHYSKHRFFLTPNQLLANMSVIEKIPAILIHGRWDAVDLPEMAYLLHKNWSASKLWIIPDGGHIAKDPAISAALVKATDLTCQTPSKSGRGAISKHV